LYGLLLYLRVSVPPSLSSVRTWRETIFFQKVAATKSK
jgi:hypothetical protein